MFLLGEAKDFRAFRVRLVLLAAGLFFAVSSGSAHAGELRAAPMNPEFTEYLQKSSSRLVRKINTDGYFLGFIPPPIKLPSVKARAVLAAAAALPSTFNLRNVRGVTPIKDQGQCGSCWAFATYASLESYLKYKQGLHETRNFSEADLVQRHGFDLGACDGGNFYMSTAYLARWDGPVNTSDVPYTYGASRLEAAPAPEVQKHVQNVWFIPDRTSFTDNVNVKTAVRTYGAVAVALYWDSNYFSSTSAAYYYNGSQGADRNHGVAIVGWDDNYSKSNFTSGKQPPGNGAFLVKNSWGKGFGKNGYFYLSYYDASLEVGFSFYNAEQTINYRQAYEYDPLGWTSSLGYSGPNSTTAWFANVFTASADAASIKAVSFYTPVPGATYRIYIYKSVTGNSPRNGKLVKTVSGTITRSGYKTIMTFSKGKTPPSVTPDEKFSVVVKLTTPGYDFPIPVEEDVPGYSSAANADEGQSYVSSDGTNWEDLTSLAIEGASFENSNVCLKAFGS